MNRVVITGAGVASPLGTGLDAFFDGLHESRSGVGQIRSFDTRFFPTAFGAEVREGGEVMPSLPSEDRKARFIRTAMKELYETSAIKKYPAAQRVLHLGAGIDYFDFPGYVGRSQGAVWRDFSQPAHQVVERLAEDFSIDGGYSTNVAACVASSQALGLAMRVLRSHGDLAVISGGFDSMLSHLHYMGFYKLGVLSAWEGEAAAASRPFDRQSAGLVIGEGATALLLESETNATREHVLCELAGYAATMDAYMVTDPEPSGRLLAQAALSAISDAGISPDDIDTVDLHGTGTLKNARAEVCALERIFPQRYREIPVFALKGQVGHLIGACGAMEVLGVIDTLRHQRVLPSVNCDEPDPQLPLNLIRGEPLPMKIRHILKLNAAFGGQNTALVFRRYE